MQTGKLPIVYSDGYSIELLGLEQLHPFDTVKYKKVYDALLSHAGLAPEQFYTPQAVTAEQLLLVHTPAYLKALENPSLTARIAGVTEIARIPPHLIEESIYKPMKLATGGTILAATLALSHGWAINLSGGYHHAKADSGGGFCYFADIPVAVHILWNKNPELRILVVDLDAHQGNGYASVFQDDERVFIYDLYNRNIYPLDKPAAGYIDFAHPVSSGIDDSEYIRILQTTLPDAIKKSNPGLIIYNAGTDVFEEDPLGGMKLSKKGIVERDSIVFTSALKNNIPVCMVLSGGYTKKSAQIISESIEFLISTVIPAQKPGS
ncbi:MAG: histone deacetylase [Spirochaetales bacterium]|nr:histone deacetylase [Spirochaetales bacterium]